MRSNSLPDVTPDWLDLLPKRGVWGSFLTVFSALFVGASLFSASAGEVAAEGVGVAAEKTVVGVEYFETHVRPLLIEHCYECHSAEAGESMGDLRLDSQPAMARGGSRGPVVVPGDAAASVLLAAVSYDDA